MNAVDWVTYRHNSLVRAGAKAALIIGCCVAISLVERTFDCLRDALLVPDGEVVAVEEHPCHTTRIRL